MHILIYFLTTRYVALPPTEIPPKTVQCQSASKPPPNPTLKTKKNPHLLNSKFLVRYWIFLSSSVVESRATNHEPCSEARRGGPTSGGTSHESQVTSHVKNASHFSNIFKYFQSFHIIFRIFSIVSHHFSNIFKRFQTFLSCPDCLIVTA